MFWTATSSRFSYLLTALSDLGHPSLPFNLFVSVWHTYSSQAPGFSLGWLTSELNFTAETLALLPKTIRPTPGAKAPMIARPRQR